MKVSRIDLVLGLASGGFVTALVLLFWLVPPGCVWDARKVAKEVRLTVSEADLRTYLAACELDIQRGVLSPTNCVPAWIRGIQAPHALSGTGSRIKDTNLCITAIWADGRGFMSMTISNDLNAHRPGSSKSSHTVKVWQNCSISVATAGY